VRREDTEEMSVHRIPNELFQALAVAPGDPRWAIERRADHPLRAQLESALASIPHA
jgi:hypothetical protein